MNVELTLFNWVLIATAAGLSGGLLLFMLYSLRLRRTREWHDYSSAQLGIFAVGIGAVFGLLGALLTKHDVVLDLICAAVTAVLVVQIGETLRAQHLTKRMQSLERALDSEFIYERVTMQLDALERVNDIRQRNRQLSPLLQEFVGAAYDRLSDSLEGLAEGTITIDDTSRELTFNTDCLEHLARREVWAVSYEDSSFWDEVEGKEFLQLHSKKINNGVTIHRIFVLREDEVLAQSNIIEEQLKLRIDCRILLIGKNNPGLHPEDFVLYDELFVRSATLVRQGPTTSLKSAVLSCASRKVNEYIVKRNDFKTRSAPAQEVIDRLRQHSLTGAASTTGAFAIPIPSGTQVRAP